MSAVLCMRAAWRRVYRKLAFGGLLGALFGLALGWPHAVLAESLAYRFGWSGFTLGTLRLECALDVASYRCDAWFSSAGLVALFAPQQHHLATRGILRGEQVQPLQFRNDYRDDETPRWLDITYQSDGTVQRFITSSETEEEGERPAVPPEKLAGSVDPLSSVVKLHHQAQQWRAGQGKALEISVFDGKRLSLVRFAPNAADSHIVYVTRTPVAGYKPRELARIRAQKDAVLTLQLTEDGWPQTLSLPLWGGELRGARKN